MQINSLKLQDIRFGNEWTDRIFDKWLYDDFKENEKWCKGWTSMDCAFYNLEDNRVYLGITSFDEKGIFKAYDRTTGEFTGIGYEKIAKPFEAKFHRSLVKWNKNGCLYGATALLHCLDKQWQAPGGSIIKFDPKTAQISRVAIPLPHVYIQSTALDQERGLLYCQCFPPEYIITFDLNTGEVNNLGLIGTGISGMTQGENIALDDNNNLWGTWCLTRAWQYHPGVDSNRLFKIPAGGKEIQFLNIGLPKPDGSYGYDHLEAVFNLRDGYMYASGVNGSIYRINTKTNKIDYLFTPIPNRQSRLASLAVASDGCAYGVTGRNGCCEVLKFDFRNTCFELLGRVADQESEACYQIHDVVITEDGVLYACENDNPYRSGYLWEIKLDL